MTRRAIEFASATQRAPADVREEARAQLEELSESLSAIPEGSVFWDSMRISRLCLVVRGWSFLYGFTDGAVRVTEVRGN